MKALIALEDGRVFEGRSFTGPGETSGEVVFNTCMTGYQEVLTDPSYKGQIVTMTYPLIGNYGVNPEDYESASVHLEGFIVREYEDAYSNWRATESLREFLKRHNILGIEQVDTRALTRHIRLAGAMKAVMSTEDLDPASLVEKARNAPGLEGRDLVKEVVCRHAYTWGEEGPSPCTEAVLKGDEPCQEKGFNFRVAVIDCGLKYNQLRIFHDKGCQCVVYPCSVNSDELLACKPDGIFVSNGPGDPAALGHVVKTVENLLGKRPVFGICLGHQILGQAFGGKTYKLKFGHHGGNQPVKDLSTDKVEITSQNHGFAVDDETLPSDVQVTHINLNDNTVEGISHKNIPAFSVQYHPENAPGPHDAEYLFDRFITMMSDHKT